MTQEPSLRDLGIVGDRRTAAVVTRAGSVVWYCPGQFDAPSLLAGLVDPARGGEWRLEGDVTPLRRAYLGDSGVLETHLDTAGGEVTLVDFMPYGPELPRGVCRLVRGTAGATLVLTPAPDYARRPPLLTRDGNAVRVDGNCWLSASHPLHVEGDTVRLSVPPGESGWALLGERPQGTANPEGWLDATLTAWRGVAAETTHSGPYAGAVRDSLRALRLLTFEESGSVISAATTSLPEVIGGTRNYDYRYVWFRDSGMIVRALSRLSPDRKGTLGHGFLDFVCRYASGRDGDQVLPPLATVCGEDAPPVEELPLAGYRGSRPVRIGNAAVSQVQLDVYGNILLASAALYDRAELEEHWPTLEPVAEYLCGHWQDPDNGIWEEEETLPYLSSKVLGAVGLERLADLHPDPATAQRWRSVAGDIRAWVSAHGLTSEGAFAAVAGEEEVDVVAALYPAWGYCAPGAPEMRATLRVLERDHCREGLYWRALREKGTGEGAFLAGTLWVALYWTALDPERARRILETVLGYTNDLGLIAEEADPTSGTPLGNFPQTFVHAALLGVIAELT
ncbi:glycoside hydrolase family 15 protein [Deinococcus aestuarii]|uniref:glycoside hydrolase family 15 protein n=1 Tax=Deinococcus aestuarii TaxID=2774531 RepID=UPI001C0B5F22|nr:glycoside hydrolase family 15 protein [Deinococcus aestuarii]